MLRDDDHWRALTEAFYSAALDGESWHGALEGLAEATGSAIGELICLGPNAGVPVNIVTGIDPAFHDAFVAAGGGDPDVNPRVGAGSKAPTLKVLAENDFITPEDYKRNSHYQEFAIPWDIPFICLTTLERTSERLIGLAVARNRKQGHISTAEREVFATLAPHVRAAVRMQLALEGQGSQLLTGAMEALSVAAFVCDGRGLVQAMTPTAEQLLQAERGLQLRQRRLGAPNPLDARELQAAIDAAAAGAVQPGTPPVRSVVVRAEPEGNPTLVLDVAALPMRPYQFHFTPRVLVIARGEHGAAQRRRGLLQAAYSLTAAETDIAMHIFEGRTPEAIAVLRGVSVGTVRVQIKGLLAKLGVKRQVELVARIGQL